MTQNISSDKTVLVTGAVIEQEGRILIMRRGPGGKLAGKWEFPGGKIEPGETPAQCLARELREELGIDATIGDLLWTGDHAYPDRTVRMFFLRVSAFSGTISLRDHDQMEWVAAADLENHDLLPADLPFARWLAISKRTSNAQH